MHKDIWKVLFKANEAPLPMTKDRGNSLTLLANPVGNSEKPRPPPLDLSLHSLPAPPLARSHSCSPDPPSLSLAIPNPRCILSIPSTLRLPIALPELRSHGAATTISSRSPVAPSSPRPRVRPHPDPSSCHPRLEAPYLVPSIPAASSFGSSFVACLHSPTPSGYIHARGPCRSPDDITGGHQEADAALQDDAIALLPRSPRVLLVSDNAELRSSKLSSATFSASFSQCRAPSCRCSASPTIAAPLTPAAAFMSTELLRSTPSPARRAPSATLTRGHGFFTKSSIDLNRLHQGHLRQDRCPNERPFAWFVTRTTTVDLVDVKFDYKEADSALRKDAVTILPLSPHVLLVSDNAELRSSKLPSATFSASFSQCRAPSGRCSATPTIAAPLTPAAAFMSTELLRVTFVKTDARMSTLCMVCDKDHYRRPRGCQVRLKHVYAYHHEDPCTTTVDREGLGVIKYLFDTNVYLYFHYDP
ncbi:flocculation protein FLO11-like [Triticum dicoccoides]|uniref:flocculation protein FLO11-like n=1 Tax=Triticum dicoccoides TaxID=85692 RepID=UPI0018915D25|nr:flocculation protein FLO11-like [Triticum dicoccoides]